MRLPRALVVVLLWLAVVCSLATAIYPVVTQGDRDENDPANDPYLVPTKDSKSINAQMFDSYKHRIWELQGKISNMGEEGATSLAAAKIQMEIEELQLSRAEACKQVLHNHGINANWTVDPHMDQAMGGIAAGYDNAAKDPLKKHYRVLAPDYVPPPPPATTYEHRLDAAIANLNPHDSAPAVQDLSDLDLGETASTTADANDAVREVQELDATTMSGDDALNAVANETQKKPYIEDPLVITKKIAKAENRTKVVQDGMAAASCCDLDGMPWGCSHTQQCTDYHAELEQLGERLAAAQQELVKAQRVKRECVTFMEEMKAKRGPDNRITKMIVDGIDEHRGWSKPWR